MAEAGGLSSPHDVEIAADGTIWVADASNDRLVQMSDNLKTLRTVKGPAYAFNGPRYLDFDAKGRLYVADKYTHRIKVLDPTVADTARGMVSPSANPVKRNMSAAPSMSS